MAQIESVFVPLPPEHVERAWEETGDGRAIVSAEEARNERERDFVAVIPAQGGSVLVSHWSKGARGMRGRIMTLLRRRRSGQLTAGGKSAADALSQRPGSLRPVSPYGGVLRRERGLRRG